MFKEIFLKRWVVIVNGLLLAYSIAAAFRDAFSSETQQKYQLNLLLHSLSWQSWVTIFALGNFLIVLHGAWLAIQKRESANAMLKGELEEIERTKPKIRLREPNAVYVESVHQNHGNQVFDNVPFLKIRFINDPVGPYPSAIANDVRATIDYYRCHDNVLLLTIEGRWARSDQPSASNPLLSRTGLLPATFGIGEIHELDIAYRDAQDDAYYAWNNDNYNYPSFRNPVHLLHGNEFCAEIRLRGTMVDERYSVRFRTTENGFEIENYRIMPEACPVVP